MTDSDSYEVWVSRGKPRVGDVVITREAPFGEACQIPKDIPAACLGQRMMMYQPNSVYAIYSHAVQNRLLELAGGSTVGHIRVGDIRSLPIPHPVSLDEQREICEALNGVSSADVDSRSALTKLRRLKIGLMQDLLTGRVPVTSLLAEPQPALANT
jgi:type I restriction enzyme S subunit